MSLRKKIVLIAAAVSVMMMILVYAAAAWVSREALYRTETEKARLIGETVVPDFAVALFLGLDDAAKKKLSALVRRDDVWSASLKDVHGKRLEHVQKQGVPPGDALAIPVEIPVVSESTGKMLGKLSLIYLSRNYKALERKSLFTVLVPIAVFVLFMGALLLIINRLLYPLVVLGRRLKKYRIGDFKDDIPGEGTDEITVIQAALKDMDRNMTEYRKFQKNLRTLLEEKVQEQTKELRYRLYNDLLTRLPKRNAFVERIEKARTGTLVLVNIDRFQEINDLFGIHAGDEILVRFSEMLKRFSEERAFELFKLSGDEFAMFTPEVLTKDTLHGLLRQLIHTIETASFEWQNNEIALTATLGIAAGESKGLFERADIALKRAKKLMVPFVIYDDSILAEHEYYENMIMAKKIRTAMEREDGIFPVFQPIVPLTEGGVLKYEALIRLRDENGTVYLPGSFLPIAKKMRVYPRLTEIMIQKSCRIFADKEAEFSVNLSNEDILNPNLLEIIRQNVSECGIGGRMSVEILESEGIENYETVSKFIGEIHALGCQVAIDDFGAGYSSLEHLLKLRFDTLKIDGSLIKRMATDEPSRLIVMTIIELSKKIGVKTVAEFVHSKEVLDAVREAGADYAQGFYLSEPLFTLPKERMD